MKNLTILTAFMLLAVISLKATVHTVSNDPNQLAQYSDIQLAHDAALAGDTLLVYGSSTTYSALRTKKKLIVIGSGYEPNNIYNQPTKLDYLYIDTTNNVYGSSGCKFFGLKITQIYCVAQASHITFQRNRIGNIDHKTSNYGSATNWFHKDWKFINNILSGRLLINSHSSYWTFLNNIVLGMSSYYGYSIGGGNSTSLFSNNLFLPAENSVGVGSYCFSFTVNSTITNNIFYMRQTNSSDCSQNTYSHNIGYGTSTIVDANNNGSNNTITNPGLINIGTNQCFDYSDNYGLQSSSPAINAGSDGTDIGIYGGSYPFPHGYGNSYRYAPMPNLPIIMLMNLNVTNIPQNSNLNFTIKARKGDE